MGWRSNKLTAGVSLVMLCTAALAVTAGNSAAGELTYGYTPRQATYVTVGGTTHAPIGWIEFCVEHRAECQIKHTAARDVVFSPKVWADMVKVNAWVNETIKPVTDLDHWGVVERWSYPDDGYGDCEDYVLLKRRMLMKAGWPSSALLITVVRDKKNDGHGVLTVKTDRGEFILDNQESKVLPWNETGYRFVKRQSQSDPNTWVMLDEPRAAPAIVSARRH
jgi:predicted transglutaminase-like cysteine proteinase